MRKVKDNKIALTHYEIITQVLSSFPKKSKILDAGCGQGDLGKKLLEIGLQVFACDINEKEFLYKNIPFKHGDLNKKLPYKKNYFDIIVCLEVIEHLYNPWFLISEFHRVLREKGILILSSPNTSNILARIFNLLTGQIWLFNKFETDHVNPISYWEIERVLKDNGFKKIKILNGVNVIENVGMVTNIKNPIIKTVYYIFFKFFDLSHNLITHNTTSKKLFRSFSYIIFVEK